MTSSPDKPVMRLLDLASRPGLTVDSNDEFRSADETLFRGAFWNRELRRGLSVHGSDVVENSGFTANSAQPAGMSCVFFLDGQVSAGIGDREFRFHGAGQLEGGMLISTARDEAFRRKSIGHQRVRHVVISVTPEWLDRDGLAAMNDARPGASLAKEHLASRGWRGSPRLAPLVDRILSANAPSPIGDLLVESAAVEIMAEALAAATHQDLRGREAALSQREAALLRRATDYIMSRQDAWPTVEEIARQAGTSASGLQRLFRAGLETSVADFIRNLRLQWAREELLAGRSVQEAAMTAGYASPANFSTAFKRRFGHSPRQTR